MFLLDENVTGLPRAALIDPVHGDRQDGFRRKLWDTHLCKPFGTADELRRLVGDAVTVRRDRAGALPAGQPATTTLTQNVKGNSNISIGAARDITISPPRR